MRARSWAIVLGISVALNLFFLGWFSARSLQRRELHPGPPARGQLAGGPRRVREQHPRPLEWMSEAERSELRPTRKGLRSARRDAEAAMRAEPFDPERLRQALAALRSKTDEIQASAHEYMLRRATAMSPDERRRLADAQWGPERGPMGGRGPLDNGGDGPQRGPERRVNDGR